MTVYPTNTIAAIVGPTACGKTAVSIEVAHMLDAEIVSADSIQIYQGLDVGSAKPDITERRGIPHHMLDVLPPTSDGFSVAAYQRMAFACIDDILSRGKRPLIVGGTGLYIAALTRPMDFTAAAADDAYRAKWMEAEAREPGSAHRALSEIDPESAARLHPNDARRIIRALEIQHCTGMSIGAYAAADRARKPRYHSVIAGLTMPRETLYQRIECRAAQMRTQGLVAEVEGLLAQGCDPDSTSMQGLGYKEIVAALRTTQPETPERTQAIDEAFARIALGTRRYAKRQWTWFRRDERIRWFDVSAYDDVKSIAAAVAAHFETAQRPGEMTT